MNMPRATALLCGLVVVLIALCVLPQVQALPSFARQTGQKCEACHVSGSWPQLTPWGRYFKLTGYTAGKRLIDKEGVNYVPVGVLGQVGLTWAQQPNDANGQNVIPQNGRPEAYAFAGEFGSNITDFLGIFYEYNIGNTYPGWKGSAGPVDLRAVHFFHPLGSELLVGVDMNNNPAEQDVWNSSPTWAYPFYLSPAAPGAPAGPIISSLGQQVGGTGIYGLLNRHWYGEISMYHVGTEFFRWMNPGTAFQAGGKNYLQGFNPYWRAYYTTDRGPQSLMVGTFGIQAKVFPDSTAPTGPTDVFTDFGFDSQYQYLGETQKLTLRGSYTYENQRWNASYAQGTSSNFRGNLKALNLNGSYGYRDHWVFNAAYFLSNGNSNTALYAVSDPAGNVLTSSPKTSGYVLEVDRLITQNFQATLQYKGFLRYNGLSNNIDGAGRSASDNNTLWLTVFFAF